MAPFLYRSGNTALRHQANVTKWFLEFIPEVAPRLPCMPIETLITDARVQNYRPKLRVFDRQMLNLTNCRNLFPIRACAYNERRRDDNLLFFRSTRTHVLSLGAPSSPNFGPTGFSFAALPRYRPWQIFWLSPNLAKSPRIGSCIGEHGSFALKVTTCWTRAYGARALQWLLSAGAGRLSGSRLALRVKAYIYCDRPWNTITA